MYSTLFLPMVIFYITVLQYQNREVNVDILLVQFSLSTFFRFFFFLWPKIWFVLVYILWMLERNVYAAINHCNVA